MKLSAHKKLLGFTLIELLVVITIISTLAVVVFVALNPAQRLIDAKNARRQTDVDTILTAIHASIVDDRGTYPSNMPAAHATNFTQLGTAAATCTSNACGDVATACADIMTGTQNLTPYLKSMPIDPTAGSTYDAARTGYAVNRNSDGIVTVKSCGAEGTTIQSSR